MGEKPEHAVIEGRGNSLRFVVHAAPRPDTVDAYVSLWRSLGVSDVVRACEATFPDDACTSAGIRLHNLPSEDGDVPAQPTVDAWLALVRDVFRQKRKKKGGPSTESSAAIAVFCVAGLGRSPLLVAVALLEFGGFSGGAGPVIEHVRRRRPRALNLVQLRYLQNYKPQSACLLQ